MFIERVIFKTCVIRTLAQLYTLSLHVLPAANDDLTVSPPSQYHHSTRLFHTSTICHRQQKEWYQHWEARRVFGLYFCCFLFFFQDFRMLSASWNGRQRLQKSFIQGGIDEKMSLGSFNVASILVSVLFQNVLKRSHADFSFSLTFELFRNVRNFLEVSNANRSLLWANRIRFASLVIRSFGVDGRHSYMHSLTLCDFQFLEICFQKWRHLCSSSVFNSWPDVHDVAVLHAFKLSWKCS